MEMNFPHKSLDQASSVSETKARGAHQALLAHAIARQALSPSARAYAARHFAGQENQTARPRNMMQDRIAFFAGLELPRKGSSDDSPSKTMDYPFEKGHFRPDISGKKKPENGV